MPLQNVYRGSACLYAPRPLVAAGGGPGVGSGLGAGEVADGAGWAPHHQFLIHPFGSVTCSRLTFLGAGYGFGEGGKRAAQSQRPVIGELPLRHQLHAVEAGAGEYG